jgi:hypothetical protein
MLATDGETALTEVSPARMRLRMRHHAGACRRHVDARYHQQNHGEGHVRHKSFCHFIYKSKQTDVQLLQL